jgi:Ca2+-binding RTX toxin-like protein
MTRSTRVLLVLALLLAGASISATSVEAAPQCFGQDPTIFGDAGDNVLMDTEGNDVIWAGPGNDRIIVKNGGLDYVCGGDGNDRIIWAGNGASDGEAGNDRFFLRGGSAAVGGAGNDRFYLISGDFGLTGGTGRDTVDMSKARFGTGGEGVKIDLRLWESNVLWSRGSADTTGIENITGSAHADRIFGNGRRNTIRALGGGDEVNGLNGDDQIFGGAGDDRLEGGGGDDLLNGEAGTGDWLHDVMGTNTCINGNFWFSYCT